MKATKSLSILLFVCLFTIGNTIEEDESCLIAFCSDCDKGNSSVCQVC